MKKTVSFPVRLMSVMLTFLLLLTMTANTGITAAFAIELGKEEIVNADKLLPGDILNEGTRLSISGVENAKKIEVYFENELVAESDSEIQLDRRGKLEKRMQNSSTDFTMQLYFKTDIPKNNVGSEEALTESLKQGGEITLTEDIVLTTGIYVYGQKTRIINTNGHSIFYGENLTSYIFYVSGGATLTIKDNTYSGNSTLSGGSSDLGGAIIVIGSKLIAQNIKFSGNNGKNGGGVLVRTGGNAEFTNCTFENNSATEQGGGLCVDTNGTASLTNCVVENNTAYDGGGIANRGTLTVNGCKVKNNTVKGGGAGIWSWGSATLINTEVSQNSNAIHGGGVTNHNDMTLKGCTISGNSASSWGGGMLIDSSGNTVLEKGNVIKENTANDGAGILFRKGKLSITDAEISGNSAKTAGGGIWANSNTTLALTNVKLENNFSGTNGGALNSHGTLSLKDCNISSNSAGNNGGGVYMDTSSSLTVNNSSITNCTAKGAGGGIYFHLGKLILAGGKTEITDNTTNGNYDNIRQREFKNFQITGRLTSGSKIGFVPPSGNSGIDVTTGFGQNNSAAPADYFYCDNNTFRVNRDKNCKEVNLIPGLRASNSSYKIRIYIRVTDDADAWDYAYFYIYGRGNRGKDGQRHINTSHDFHESIDEDGESYTYEYDCGADYFPTGVDVVTSFGNWGVWRDFEADVKIYINGVNVSSAHVVHDVYGDERKNTMINIGGDKYPYPDQFEIDAPSEIEQSAIITVEAVDQYGLQWKADKNATMENISFPGEDTFEMADNSGFKWKLSSNHKTNHISIYEITFKSQSNVYPQITKAINVKFIFPLHLRVYVNDEEVLDQTGYEKQTIKIKDVQSIPGYYISNYDKEGTGILTKNSDGTYDVTFVNESVILKARLKPVNYIITFVKNGGVDENGNSDVSGTMNNKTAYYDKDFTLPKNNLRRIGYTFAGWNTKPDGTGEMFRNQGTVRNLTSNKGEQVKLYAIWKPNNGSTTASIFSEGTLLIYAGLGVIILSIAAAVIYSKWKKRQNAQAAEQ